jgi:hypothetical protein
LASLSDDEGNNPVLREESQVRLFSSVLASTKHYAQFLATYKTEI